MYIKHIIWRVSGRKRNILCQSHYMPKIIIYGKEGLVKPIRYRIHNKKRHNNLYILPMCRIIPKNLRPKLALLYRFRDTLCREHHILWCMCYECTENPHPTTPNPAPCIPLRAAYILTNPPRK